MSLKGSYSPINLYSLPVVTGADHGHTDQRTVNLGSLVLLLHPLEIQLGEHVQVVGQLDDEVQLHQEAHGVVRVALPCAGHAEQTVTEHDVQAP